MKYLALVFYQEKIMAEKPQAEWDELNRECMECGDWMRENGHFIDGNALQTVDTATTVRVRDGKISVTDGPFTETKEQLAGYYLLNAKDINEAIRLAGKIPPARYGSIEIRPVRELQERDNTAGGQG